MIGLLFGYALGAMDSDGPGPCYIDHKSMMRTIKQNEEILDAIIEAIEEERNKQLKKDKL